jgi:hypothetical protein
MVIWYILYSFVVFGFGMLYQENLATLDRSGSNSGQSMYVDVSILLGVYDIRNIFGGKKAFFLKTNFFSF